MHTFCLRRRHSVQEVAYLALPGARWVCAPCDWAVADMTSARDEDRRWRGARRPRGQDVRSLDYSVESEKTGSPQKASFEMQQQRIGAIDQRCEGEGRKTGQAGLVREAQAEVEDGGGADAGGTRLQLGKMRADSRLNQASRQCCGGVGGPTKGGGGARTLPVAHCSSSSRAGIGSAQEQLSGEWAWWSEK